MIKPRINIDFSSSKRRIFINPRDEYSTKPNEFLFNHNRSALLFILNYLKISGGNVAVLVYNCHTVSNAIHQAGCNPIYIDVDKSLRIDIDDLRRKSQKYRLDAIIITHLFGIPNDIDAIRNIVNIPIIEDCAHAFLSPGCGDSGDFAVYSIGQGKFPSVGDGGICIVKNPNYIEGFKNSYFNISEYSRVERLSLFFRMTAKHIIYHKSLYSFFRKFKPEKTIVAAGRIQIKKMDKGISAIFNHYYPNLSQEMAEQQKNSRTLIQELSSQEVRPLVSPDNTNCFMLPLDCQDIYAIQTLFLKNGIETATHFKNCIEWAKTFGYIEGSCTNSEYFTKHLLLVPTYQVHALEVRYHTAQMSCSGGRLLKNASKEVH